MVKNVKRQDPTKFIYTHSSRIEGGLGNISIDDTSPISSHNSDKFLVHINSIQACCQYLCSATI